MRKGTPRFRFDCRWLPWLRAPRVLAVFILMAASLVQAEDDPGISGIVVFGASLSDVGNVHLATMDSETFIPFTQPPYFLGRFSNGPVWHEVMATRLGLEPASLPSLAGGNNFAWGGAEVGPGLAELIGVPNLGFQIDQFLLLQDAQGLLPLPNDQLFIVASGGGNNLVPPGEPQQPETIVEYIEGHVRTLASAGARLFLVPNFFDIELAPFIAPGVVNPGLVPPGVESEADRQEILERAELTNRQLKIAMRGLEARLNQEIGGVTIIFVDHYRASHVITEAHRLFGIENTTEQAMTPLFPACFCTGTIEEGVDPNKFFWFDSIHPTATVHELLGEYAAFVVRQSLNAADR